jgi:Icc-related predicted phosphoesterase
MSKLGIMTVRGAYSIDQSVRIEGVNWWRNEEISYKKMEEIIKFYEGMKPKIMTTHECPQSIRDYLFGIKERSITSMALETMFQIHQPDLWIFGHHHISKNEIINGTKFICLEELQFFKI